MYGTMKGNDGAQEQAAGGVCRQDFERTLGEVRSGVSACIHLHDRRACECIPMQNGGLDGGRSAPTREQGRMHINTSKTRQIQHILAQYFAIGGHDDHIRRPGIQFFQGFGLAQPLRLDNLQAKLEGESFDGRRG